MVVFVGLLAVFTFLDRELSVFQAKRALEKSQLPASSFPEAMALAEQSGKPVLANFSAIWCPACMKLERDVLTEQAVIEAIETSVHYTRVEYEDEVDRRWFDRYSVNSFPTLVLIDRSGLVIDILDNPAGAKNLLRGLSSGLAEAANY